MKKFLLVIAIFFVSISGSFAFQQALYAGPPVNYNGMMVNINANCSYVKLDCSWSGIFGDYSSGSAVAHSDGTLIGEYSWWTGYGSPSYSNGIFSSRYWGTVSVTLAAYNCYGQAILEWMP